MKTKYVSQTILFLSFTVRAQSFAWLLPQKRTATRPATEASRKNTNAEEVEGQNEKLPISGRPFLVQDLQEQQSEQAHWMSQQNQHHYYNNDNIKNTHQDASFWKSHDQNEPALRIQELQEEVEHWKNRFDQMRFRLVHERRHHKQHVLELRERMKQLEEKLEKSNKN